MKRPFLLFTLIVAACTCFAKDIRSEVKATYAKWAAATQAKDLDGLMALLHPSYRGFDVNGQSMGYKEMRGMMESYTKMMKDAKIKFDFERIEGFGNEASAWVTFSASFKVKQNGKWVAQSFSTKVYETLMKTEKGWVFTESRELP